jgi:two-component system LytT family response regulator
MSQLRVVVVDDEQLAREGLVEMLERDARITIVGAFGDALSALAAIDSVRPDALFVDIQMPGMTGLELVDLIEADPFPAVVFVTAHDAFAIRAFELNAMDYLLKPVSSERLTQTLNRLHDQLPGKADVEYRSRLAALLEGMLPGHSQGVGRLIVREVGQVIVVATREVDWIEGADYYAKLHVGPRIHLLRETLVSLERRLDPRRFMRINKSAIINLTRVKAVETHQRGEGLVVLVGNIRLKVTRARREDLERKLEELHDTR